MPDEVIVLVLRRDPHDLLQIERDMITAFWPGKDVRFIRIDSVDHKQHYDICKLYGADAVLVPKDRPVPSTAMEHGYQHIAITPQGVRELEPLVPTFKPFVPREDPLTEEQQAAIRDAFNNQPRVLTPVCLEPEELFQFIEAIQEGKVLSAETQRQLQHVASCGYCSHEYQTINQVLKMAAEAQRAQRNQEQAE